MRVLFLINIIVLLSFAFLTGCGGDSLPVNAVDITGGERLTVNIDVEWPQSSTLAAPPAFLDIITVEVALIPEKTVKSHRDMLIDTNVSLELIRSLLQSEVRPERMKFRRVNVEPG